MWMGLLVRPCERIVYWREKETKPILYLFFEDMKDPAREIRCIAQFLGHHLSDELIHDIMHMTTFTAMKENPIANYSTVPDAVFNREVGDWQNNFSPQENTEFDEQYSKMMAKNTIPFHFLI
uniref:Sulfotransferase n=1 Tax=Salmo trutta TaxID=8032 RepID=A0A673ZB34_SALTR